MSATRVWSIGILFLAAGVLPLGLSQQQPPNLQGEANKHFIVYNATTKPVTYYYRAPPVDEPQQAVLKPDHYFLHREGNVTCSFGDPMEEKKLAPGYMYHFRLSAKTTKLELAAFALLSVDDQNEALKKAEENARLYKAVADRLQAALAKLEMKEDRSPIANLTLTGPPSIDAGIVEVVDAAAQVHVTFAIKHHSKGLLRLHTAAEFDATAGRVTVEPAVVEVASDDKVKLTLKLNDAVGGGDRSGRILLTCANPAVKLAIPVTMRLQSRLTRLPASKNSLTILTWPAGAEVYLADMAGPRGARRLLGTTPVVQSLPAGDYQVLIVRPSTEEGAWAAGQVRPETVGFGPRTWPGLVVNVAHKPDEPTLVRAFFLKAGAGSAAERLADAAADAPPLFEPPAFAPFQLFATRALAKVGVALNEEEDARKLFDVLKRSGTIPYPLADGGILNLELRPGADPLRSQLLPPAK